MTTIEQLRIYLKARLENEKLTLNQLAIKSSISQGGLSMILQGKRGISVTTLEQIATALCLDSWKLLKEAAEYNIDQIVR